MSYDLVYEEESEEKYAFIPVPCSCPIEAQNMQKGLVALVN